MGKVAIVTGSSRGIGRATARRLAEDGYDLVLNGSKPSEALDEILAEVTGLGRKAVAVPADVGDLDSHGPLVDSALGLGKLHCLVNNAGVSVMSRGDLLDVTAESYDRCMAVNARGSFFLAQRVARAMVGDEAPEPGHRSIVFITSVNAVAASINRGEYCMSKTASSMATKLFALRLAETGIGTYEIQAGLIRTEMSQPAWEKYDKMIAEGLLPNPRWGQPGDIARTVGTIASGGLEYTVGQAIQLDGGLSVVRL